MTHLETALALATLHASEGAHPEQLKSLIPTSNDRIPIDLFSDAPVI